MRSKKRECQKVCQYEVQCIYGLQWHVQKRCYLWHRARSLCFTHTKMATEFIGKYNKDQSNKTKHTPASKIKINQKCSPPTQNFCHLPGCDQPSHSIKKVTTQKYLWYNLARNITHAVPLLILINYHLIKEEMGGCDDEAQDNNKTKYQESWYTLRYSASDDGGISRFNCDPVDNIYKNLVDRPLIVG